ncbi:MAG: 2-hydroxy-3-oxopropionate reductase [Chloroflexota bacterium]|nr:2-hydroxy-3-oxopropionate reductase [Chloroflexota bacterium]
MMTAATATTAPIGFIGLGIMGRPMARNLVKAGYALVVHNRSRGPVDDLVQEGNGAVEAADHPAAVAARAETVITMLPDSPDVRDVVFGDNGLAGAMRQGHLLIDMSTIAPATAVEVAEALAKQGAHALDAPVSGGDKGAIAATLSIMIGGEAADVERAMPLFEAMGKTIVHVGKAGAGQVVKACNQIVVALNYAAVSEALVLGAKAGVDPAKIVQVLSGGLAASRVLEMRGPTMLKHDFAPGFRVDLHRKDLGIALATGREQQVPLPVTALVSQIYDAVSAAGRGGLDHSALLTAVEGFAGYTIPMAEEATSGAN